MGRLNGPPPVWLESRAPLEERRLRRDPVFAGEGLARGDGLPVLLVPGFMGGDASMDTLRGWLLRLGYRAEASGLVFNIRYSEAVLETLEDRLRALFADGGPVALVGHSRGGLLAKVLAHRHPSLVATVVGMGSPLADPYDVHPFTMACVRAAQVANMVRYGRSSGVERRFLADLAAPARVPLTSIYSRTDGIVHWEACLRQDATCLEVGSSHVGLAVNRAVYALLSGLLSVRRGRQRA
jgi:triacylglycerol lipase